MRMGNERLNHTTWAARLGRRTTQAFRGKPAFPPLRYSIAAPSRHRGSDALLRGYNDRAGEFPVGRHLGLIRPYNPALLRGDWADFRERQEATLTIERRSVQAAACCELDSASARSRSAWMRWWSLAKNVPSCIEPL